MDLGHEFSGIWSLQERLLLKFAPAELSLLAKHYSLRELGGKSEQPLTAILCIRRLAQNAHLPAAALLKGPAFPRPAGKVVPVS
jgi:hypothetical protein